MNTIKKKTFYLIGSLRNNYVRELELKLLANCPNIDVFAEWHGAGNEADDHFKAYHQGRGRSFREALKTDSARNIFEFDKAHLDSADGAIVILPTGFSCALEAGYVSHSGRPIHAIYPNGEPDQRWDIMVQFLTSISYNEQELIEKLNA